jgi:hypothetical protein
MQVHCCSLPGAFLSESLKGIAQHQQGIAAALTTTGRGESSSLFCSSKFLQVLLLFC